MISLVITLAILGLVWYLVVTLIPMPQPVKTVISVVIGVIMIIALLRWLPGVGLL